jgi:hypothetical protein
MSSKRDYVAIAKVIDEADGAMCGCSDHRLAREEIASGIATHFEEHNPAFDREQFLKACGVGQ